MFTVFACIIIFIAWAWAYKYVYDASDSELKKNRKWVEQLPSLIATLGVIGTFVGITIGLMGFDEKDIEGSIPTLLDGLKIAFFTSLLGMTGSLILSRRVNRAYDKIEDENDDVKKIVAAIKELQESNDKGRKEMVQALQSDSLKEYIEQMADDLEEVKASLKNIQKSMNESSDSNSGKQLAELSRISAELLTASVVITKMGNDMDEIKEKLQKEE